MFVNLWCICFCLFQSDVSSLRERRNSYTQGSSTPSLPPSASDSQLKYENDRLKLALAQRSVQLAKISSFFYYGILIITFVFLFFNTITLVAIPEYTTKYA